MITAVEIKNFLSYEHAVIPMGPLTVIHGKNWSGKSNIMRACTWCLLNDGTWSDDAGRDTIRRVLPDGSLADEVMVRISFDDGSSVIRRRTAKENEYILEHSDGSQDVIQKGSVGRGYVPDVGGFTGFQPTIWPNDEKVFLNFSNDANDGRFLLSDSATAVDVKLGSVMGVDVLERAVKKADTYATSNSRAASATEKEIAAKRIELERYVGLEEAIAACNYADKAAAASADATAAWKRTAECADRFRRSNAELTRIGDGPEVIGGCLTAISEAAEKSEAARRKCLTASGLVAKMEASTGPTAEQVELFGQAIATATAADDADKSAFLTFGAAAEARKRYIAAAKSIEATEAEQVEVESELAEAISSIDACPVDGRPHQLCPFWKEETNEQTV